MLLTFTTDNVGLQLLIFFGVIVFIIAFSALFFRVLYHLYEWAGQRYFKTVDKMSELQARNALLKLNYFISLSEPGKEKFVQRLQKVLARLQFSTEGNIVADDEKKILIAASIVQITFGLKEYDIDTIEHIKVFADDIYSTKTKARFKGLTFMNGNMYISWKYFVEGIKVQNDGVNLGLHETTHGLYILLQQYRGYEEFDGILKTWYNYAYNEIDHDNKGGEFFRKYADANIQEFFAICVENFFERPEEFRKRLPVIYGQLSTFLNQDPSSRNDYEYRQENVAAAGPRSERLYLYKNRPHPSQGALLWLSALSLVGMMFLKVYFLETLFNLLLYSIPCMFISYNLFKKFYLYSKRMSKKWYIVFCFVAINPIVFTLFLLLNVALSSGIAGSRTFNVESIDRYGLGINQNDFSFTDAADHVFMLEDNYTVPIEWRDVKIARGKAEMRKVRSVIYTYHYGITGFKVFDDVQLKAE